MARTNGARSVLSAEATARGPGWYSVTLLIRAPHRRELAAAYALGLLAFEIVELAWIGLQALEVAFSLLALVMLLLAFGSKTVRWGARGFGLTESRERPEGIQL